MLESIGILFITGMLMGWIFDKLHLTRITGMLVGGVLLGSYGLNILDESLISISPYLREIALVIILTRAGLSLNINQLKKVGRPAIMMCFVPALLEIIGTLIIGPIVFGISIIDSFVLGTVLAAVSPAVIVPKMIGLIDNGYGTKKGIPQLIMAGASVDDVFVIVLFSVATGLASGGEVSAYSLMEIPISIILGIGVGVGIGYILYKFFKARDIKQVNMVIIMLSIFFILLMIEDYIAFSALLSVMATGVVIKMKDEELSQDLSNKFSGLWSGAEIILFVLVGHSLDVGYAINEAGIGVVVFIFLVLIFRIFGVYLCLIGTDFNIKEKLFCVIGYLPKATVQAGIGAIPLAMGLGCGELVLTVSVVAIVVTAPLGAIGIDITYKKFLAKE